MKTNRIFLIISVVCFSLLATGCGEPLYEMTSEEEAIISLYASKAVAKFNKNQVIGIANARVKKGELDEEYEPDAQEETDAEAVEEDTTEEMVDPETGEPIVSEEGEPDSESTEGSEEETTGTQDTDGYSFTNAVDIEGVSFTCSEFDVSNEFKASKSFVLTQVKGKKYLVLYIEAENQSDSTVDFSQYSNRQYSLSINGGEKSKSQLTLVSNDLSTFKGKLAAGEKKSFIMVFLFSNSTVENISSIELFVTSDGTTRGTAI